MLKNFNPLTTEHFWFIILLFLTQTIWNKIGYSLLLSFIHSLFVHIFNNSFVLDSEGTRASVLHGYIVCCGDWASSVHITQIVNIVFNK